MRSAAKTFVTIGSTDRPAGVPMRLERAVVLGGSMAGMLAARVLADHAATVLVIGPAATDAGEQFHTLLDGGACQFERWFPGFTTRAVAGGAQPAVWRQRARYIDGVRQFPRVAPDTFTSTRSFLQARVRDHLERLPNVEFVAGRVTGIDFDKASVTGVHYEAAGVSHHQAADFVVDATGQDSRVADWLSEAGWDAPARTSQTAGINCATAFFRRPPGTPTITTATAYYTPDLGGDDLGARFAAVENDRWAVLMGGIGDFHPGSTAQDMVRRCRRDLPAPFGQVASGDLLGGITTYRQTATHRRDWTRAAHLPAGLVALGDAVATLNPIYGQGVSSAALQASGLAMFLHSGAALDKPARHFFDLQRVVVDAAWSLSWAGDRDRPSINRPGTGTARLVGAFSDLIIDASLVDAEIGRTLADVAELVRHPSALAGPGMAWRALRSRRLPRRAVVGPLEPA